MKGHAKRLTMFAVVALWATGCNFQEPPEGHYDLKSIEYRCRDGSTRGCPCTKVPGVSRFVRNYNGDSRTNYWVRCSKAMYGPDIELCLRVGAAPPEPRTVSLYAEVDYDDCSGEPSSPRQQEDS